MAKLGIELEALKTNYRPGEVVAGSVSWQFDKPVKKLDLRLIWYTQGKGDEDTGLVESQIFEQPGHAEKRSFRFVLPNGPYSFSGTLISLTWALEVVADDFCERQTITVTPTGHEILLQALPDDKIDLPFGIKMPENAI
ncbi:hypothetical protein ACFL6U_01480 [Planctomycetota bacterium]